MNRTPQMLKGNRILNWGFRLQAALSQKGLAGFPWSGPHFHHSTTNESWQMDRRLCSAMVMSYLPTPNDAMWDKLQPQCWLSPGKHCSVWYSCCLLLPFLPHFSFFALSLFLFYFVAWMYLWSPLPWQHLQVKAELIIHKLCQCWRGN